VVYFSKFWYFVPRKIWQPWIVTKRCAKVTSLFWTYVAYFCLEILAAAGIEFWSGQHGDLLDRLWPVSRGRQQCFLTYFCWWGRTRCADLTCWKTLDKLWQWTLQIFVVQQGTARYHEQILRLLN
jgi:hypothetical protein